MRYQVKVPDGIENVGRASFFALSIAPALPKRASTRAAKTLDQNAYWLGCTVRVHDVQRTLDKHSEGEIKRKMALSR